MRKGWAQPILTPSKAGADEITEDVIEQLKFPVFSAADLENSKTKFSESTHTVAVIANRYDGIDFPEDDCLLLFAEGLPRANL